MAETGIVATPVPAGSRPGRYDRLVACGALAVLVISLLYTPETPPGLSVCAFHSTTGLPCPGCGLTRSFCAISHLRWGDAWTLNPFGFIWYALTLLLAARPALLRRTGYAEWERRWMVSRWSCILPLALVISMWVFGLCRMWNVARQRSAPAAVQTTAGRPGT